MGAWKIHCDATYKCIWQGFPVLVVGTTDMFRKFHAFGVAVCTHETTIDFEFLFDAVKSGLLQIFNENFNPQFLISDAAGSIHAAFKNIFGDDKHVVMCWYHMRSAVSKKLPSFLRDQKQRITFLCDVDKLQLSKSSDVFDKASTLFIEKWRTVSDELANYFTSEWLVKNRHWYEGFAHHTPSTNNAVESFNRKIKDEQTLRERLDLSQFRFAMFKMVTDWSMEYENGMNVINNDGPNVTLELETNAYNWANSAVEITTKRGKGKIFYRIPSSESGTQIENLYREATSLTAWKDFGEFKRESFAYYDIVFPSPLNKHNWLEGRCDCEKFYKLFICQHIIGIALRLKLTNVRDEAKNVPLGAKRKRGRPTKAKAALQLQD